MLDPKMRPDCVKIMSKKSLTIGELLQKDGGVLKVLREGAQAADETLIALKSLLPSQLADAIRAASIQQEGHALDIICESPGMATRLRFALGELDTQLVTTLKLVAPYKVKIKVRTQARKTHPTSLT
jgi:Dna[CI] antecedent, DciA